MRAFWISEDRGKTAQLHLCYHHYKFVFQLRIDGFYQYHHYHFHDDDDNDDYYYYNSHYYYYYIVIYITKRPLLLLCYHLC